ncbi:putative enzyme [Rubellimicrobium thermophilum DSM 16684]|uniref:Putative enzyme n=1 Tax=Rubellimicrobium thermophilum DSM 16684 TaxID=1123069 RepID=S9R413_9RHOB|nr:VOC family protein [Rubellimicrobium thermophilum]EPX86652.1 putative enzyme [Rubellimicrobium thermophilum DSM 16684]
MRLSVTVDVPDLAAGIAFWSGAFGLREVARPHPAYAVLEAGGQSLGLLEKPEGSRATPAEGTERRYARHWTPVHLDLHVEDWEGTLAAVERLGGTVEQRHPAAPGRPPVAFCADPFGHGFCVLGPRA